MLDKNQWLAIGLVSGFAYILGKDKKSFEAEIFESQGNLKFSNREIIQLLFNRNWKCPNCDNIIKNKQNIPFSEEEQNDITWAMLAKEYDLTNYDDINVVRKKPRGSKGNLARIDGELNFDNLLLLCHSCNEKRFKERKETVSFRTSKEKKEWLEQLAKDKDIGMAELMNDIVDDVRYYNEVESFEAKEFFRCKNCDYNVELEVEAVFEDGLCSNCLVKEGFQKEYGTHGKWMKNGEYAKKIKGATYEDYDAESFEAEDTNDETVYIISGLWGNIIGTKKQLIKFTNKVKTITGLDDVLTKKGVKLLLDSGMNILDIIRLKKSGFIREVKKISPDYTKSDTFKEENPWFPADVWPTIKILNDLKKPITIFDEISYRAESFEAKEMRREWTFLWKPKNEGWGNSVYATNLNGAKEQILKTYPKGSSFFQRADLSTLTDDPFVNKQRWRNWDSQWDAESFDAERIKQNIIPRGLEGNRVFVVSSVDYETDGEDVDLPQNFTFILDEHDTALLDGSKDMQEIADLLVDNISDETGWLVQGFYFQERMPDGTLVDLDAESFEAENLYNSQKENMTLVALGRAHQEILNGGERATMEIWFEGRPVMFAIDNAAGYFAINPRVLQSRYDSHNFVEPEWRDEYHQALSALKEAFPTWSMFWPKLEKRFDL